MAIIAQTNSSTTRERVAENVERVTSEKGRYYVVTEGGSEHKLPSVTTVMHCIGKPALVKWAEREGRDGAISVAADLYSDLIKGGGKALSRTSFVTTLQQRIPKQRATEKALAKASEIGTHAHALVEHHLHKMLGHIVEAPAPPKVEAIKDAAQWAFDAWLSWASSVDLKPITIEQTIYSLKRRKVAGTLDLLAYVEGKKKVLDWKTGKSIYAEAFLQNAVYQDAVEEMGHGPVEGGLIVRLPKKIGDPEFEVADVPERVPLLETFDAVHVLWKWWEAEEKKATAKYYAKRSAKKAA